MFVDAGLFQSPQSPQGLLQPPLLNPSPGFGGAGMLSPLGSPLQAPRQLPSSGPANFGGWVPQMPGAGSVPTSPVPGTGLSSPSFATSMQTAPGSGGYVVSMAVPSLAPPSLAPPSLVPSGSQQILHPAGNATLLGSGGPAFGKVPSDGGRPPMTKVPSDFGRQPMTKVPSDGGPPMGKVPSNRSDNGNGSSPDFGTQIRGSKDRSAAGLDDNVRDICERIDTDGNGYISKLEMIAAVQHDKVVASFVLPGKDSSQLMSEEDTFDEVDAIFDKIACGKQRIKYGDFAAHFKKKASEKTSNACEMRAIYSLIDADGNGSISKLELVGAVQANPAVAAFILPGMNSNHVLEDEKTFDAINHVFEAIAGGKRRIDFSDFASYYKKVTSLEPRQNPVNADRTNIKVFIIGPGFGMQLNPQQCATITNAGYQVQWCFSVPNPETPNFPVLSYLDQVKAELDAFGPDVVCCASKGGIYMVALWQMGYWRGPSVLINAHPTCKQLPEGVPIVLCQGGNDEVYPTNRQELERIMSTGSNNHCFLYYVASSGLMPSGQPTRIGDSHNMASLLFYDTLPRLIDATLCKEGPEVHLVRSWRERLGDDRIEAESWLGYSPDALRKRWSTRGMDEQKLHEVPRGTEEFRSVETAFKSRPKEPPAYQLAPQATWDSRQILKIERVENALQQDGSTRPYYDSLRRTIEDQGIDFEHGTHTSWAFHGAQPDAIDSIISNPLAGFQPLASGTRNSNVWGSGTYFARDAKYVADGGFCGQQAPDGSRKMLMCLLMSGMPCLGDPSHKGVLPYRIKPHRYNSSVDSLSSPEISIIQHPGGALPAYLITFI
eukprot:TRINITY_DN24093_c0_g1_i1.p1 TRINITY_DN24093_c0_g1~~TRINITY_DN24093_c0_g1_i1.p1  ORF type:complete len:831 (+),score=183.30 TRINITY_DN24093_c0_g1_i1:104-2596(+)